MAVYTFTFKKDDIFVEFVTTDKDLIERQFKLWVTCASVYAYNKEKQEKGLKIEDLPKVQSKPVEITPTKEILSEIKKEVVPVKKEISELKEEFAKTIGQQSEIATTEEVFEKENALDEIFKPTINSIQTSQSEGTQEVERSEQVVPEGEKEVLQEGSVIQDLPVQENSPEPEPLESKENFDKILEDSMTKLEYIPEVKKDEKYLKVLRVKNVSEKLDYLIVTAYYLSEFENLSGFTLKQINAKLMENINEVIDHGILQDAKDIGYIELIPNSTNVTSGAEYRLTEAGEEAFLNGRA